MADEWVLDASVGVKCFITEPASSLARIFVGSGRRLIAPELFFAEVASVAVKRTLRGDIDRRLADDMVASLGQLVDQTFAVEALIVSAKDIAFTVRSSLYDAVYLALAEARDCRLITADDKLIRAVAGSAFAKRVISIHSAI